MWGLPRTAAEPRSTRSRAGPLPRAQAYYFYNPFEENLFEHGYHLDGDVELSEARFQVDIEAAETLLATAPIGTCVLTYNGFGGRIPPGYRQIRVDRELPNLLRLWQRAAPGSAHVHVANDDDGDA